MKIECIGVFHNKELIYVLPDWSWDLGRIPNDPKITVLYSWGYLNEDGSFTHHRPLGA